MLFRMESSNVRNGNSHKILWILLWILAVMSKGVAGQDCLFRTDLCDWTNEGNIEWVQTSDSARTGTGHCAAVPLTGTTPSGKHQAVLTSMPQPHIMTMLGFSYRLEAPNTLTVEAGLDGFLLPMWTRNGTEAGASWIEVDVAVPINTNFKISFKAGIPENSTGFVGVTNITIRIGEDECAPMPCQNGGVCIDGNNSFTCVCSSGFKGEMCQIDTNAPPKTTSLPTTTKIVTVLPTTTTKPTLAPTTAAQKTEPMKTAPPTEPTIKYGTISTPAKLPQSGGGDKSLMKEPAMIAVIAVASVVALAVFVTVVWTLMYCKKRSWRPRYNERGLSMENVSNSESFHGKWTSTVDIHGSQPDIKPGLTPVEKNSYPRKVENIYVTSPTIGIVNTGYNIDQMY